MGYSKKIPKQGGGRGDGVWGNTLLKSHPGILRFVVLPLEILGKTSFHPWKFCKIVWHPLKIPRTKAKSHGNSIWDFLEDSWKFHFFLIDPWNFSMFFLTPGNPMSSTLPVCIFSEITQLHFWFYFIFFHFMILDLK